jgi:transposase
MHPGHSIGAVYLYRPAIDFRKSIGGLSALVEQELGLNPFGDALYLFINRRRDKLKALYWHRNGFCLWYKRLEAERFAWPARGRPAHLRADDEGARVAARRLRPVGGKAA